jgi:hypothetical protein
MWLVKLKIYTNKVPCYEKIQNGRIALLDRQVMRSCLHSVDTGK